MALIKCKECGSMISDKAKKCPKCGCPTTKEEEKPVHIEEAQPLYVEKDDDGKSRKWLYAIIALLLIVFAGGGYFIINHARQDSIKDEIFQNIVNNMVPVEGGTFTMGTISAHKVTLSSFSIGKYEVTQEEWEAVMGNNPSVFESAKLPVELVSWDEC